MLQVSPTKLFAAVLPFFFVPQKAEMSGDYESSFRYAQLPLGQLGETHRQMVRALTRARTRMFASVDRAAQPTYPPLPRAERLLY